MRRRRPDDDIFDECGEPPVAASTAATAAVADPPTLPGFDPAEPPPHDAVEALPLPAADPLDLPAADAPGAADVEPTSAPTAGMSGPRAWLGKLRPHLALLGAGVLALLVVLVISLPRGSSSDHTGGLPPRVATTAQPQAQQPPTRRPRRAHPRTSVHRRARRARRVRPATPARVMAPTPAPSVPVPLSQAPAPRAASVAGPTHDFWIER